MYQYDHKKRNIIVSVLTVVGSLCVLVPLLVAISFDWYRYLPIWHGLIMQNNMQ